MYYLFHGKDTQKSRSKLQATTSSFSKKNPHSNIFRLNEDDFDINIFSGYLGGQSLFSDKLLIVCDNIFNNAEAEEFIFEHLREIKESPNIFIFLEEELKKNELEELEKYSEKVFVFENKKEENKENGFNIFSISDAFGDKDKKKLWVAFNKAKREGISAEEVFWKITWQIKNIILAKLAIEKGDGALGKLKISPFVLNKAKKYSKKFKDDEIKSICKELIGIYHESRRQGLDFGNSLEAFILNLK